MIRTLLISSAYLLVWSLFYHFGQLEWLIQGFPQCCGYWIESNQILILFLIMLLAIVNIPVISPFPHVRIKLNVVGCIVPLLLSCGLYWYCPPLRHLLLLPVVVAALAGLLCSKLTNQGVFMNIEPLIIITGVSTIISILWTGHSGYLPWAPQIAFISAFMGSLLGGDIVRIPLAWIQKRENAVVTINIGGAGAADALFVAGLSAGVLTHFGVLLWKII